MESVVLSKLPVSPGQVSLYNSVSWVPFLFDGLILSRFVEVLVVSTVAQREVSRPNLLRLVNSCILGHELSITNNWGERF